MGDFLDYLKKKGSIGGEGDLQGVSGNKPMPGMPEMQVPTFKVESTVPDRMQGVEVSYRPAGDGGSAGSAGAGNADKVSLTDVQQHDPYAPETLDELLATRKFTPSTPEETEEERKKRERRDALRMGWSGFLDGLNALGNLYYTTKWAPNQKVGGAMAPVMSDIMEKEKLRRAQDLQRKREYKEYQDNTDKIISDWMLGSAKYNAAKANDEREHQNRMEQIEASGNARRELAGYNHQNRMELQGVRDANAMARAQVREANINERANQRGGGTGAKRSIRLSDGKSYEYGKVREGALESVFNKMKEKVTDHSEKLNVEGLKTTQQKLSWLNEHAYKYPELDAEIREALGIEGRKKKSLLPGKSNDNNNKKGSLLPK